MTNLQPTPRRSWPDYRAVWRWHFYAGLFCIPFVIVLSISGAIYLFKQEIEDAIEYSQNHLTDIAAPREVDAQIEAALKANPEATFASYELPRTITSAARVLVKQHGVTDRCYVHPTSLAVIHQVHEQDRFMRLIFRIHGELMLGDRGSYLVELAASWTLVMLLSGLFLWWPRSAKGLGGVLYPRLLGAKNIFWRDLHGVFGMWISAFAILLLVSGLPWSKFWGDYFRTMRQLTGTAVTQQDWSNGSEKRAARRSSGDHEGHTGARGNRGEDKPVDLAGVNRVAEVARGLNLAHPVLISPPQRGGTNWTVKSMAANRPLRTTIVVDSSTGAIVSREDFSDRHWVDQVVGYGIALHEGALFGRLNQLLGLLTAAGLVLLGASGVVMWWRRREAGSLGAPKALTASRWSTVLALVILALGIYLPLFGLSLVVVLLLEWSVIRRIPAARKWLSLDEPGSVPVVSTEGELSAGVLATEGKR